MATIKQASLILYRYAEKGLEVFVLDQDNTGNGLNFPKGESAACPECDEDTMIHLEAREGTAEDGFAVEGDWHDIPSLKSMVKEDLVFAKDTVKQMVPDMLEKGTFVAVKEALKKVLPHQYDMLKELKDTLLERNSVKNM